MRDIIIRLQEKHKIELIRSYICPVRSVDQTFTQTFLNIIIQLPEKTSDSHDSTAVQRVIQIMQTKEVCSPVGKDEENDRGRV